MSGRHIDLHGRGGNDVIGGVKLHSSTGGILKTSKYAKLQAKKKRKTIKVKEEDRSFAPSINSNTKTRVSYSILAYMKSKII